MAEQPRKNIFDKLKRGLFMTHTEIIEKVKESIRQQLVQQKKNEAMTTWVNGLTKDFCKGDKVKYQVGFKPNPDPCAQLNATTTDTSQ